MEDIGLYFEGGPHHGQTTEVGGSLDVLVEVRVPTPRCLVQLFSVPCQSGPAFELLTYYASGQFREGRQVVVFYLNSPRLISFEI